MKTILLFLALFFTGLQSVNAQVPLNPSLYISGGYNVSSASLTGLDFVFSRYNEQRPGYVRKLKTPSVLYGYTAGIGVTLREIYIEFNYLKKASGTITALGPASVNQDVRDYKLEANSYNLGAGFTFLKRGSFEFSLGASVDIIKIDQFTRNYKKSQQVPDFYDVDQIASGSKFTLYGFTFSPQAVYKPKFIKGFALIAAPYYEMTLNKMDFSGTNEEIDYQSFRNDPPEIQKSKMGNFGFQLRAAYFFAL